MISVQSQNLTIVHVNLVYVDNGQTLPDMIVVVAGPRIARVSPST